MSGENSFFIKARCLSTKKIYYIRYDYNAMHRWILSEAINEEEYRNKICSNHYSEDNKRNVDLSNAQIGPQYKGCPYCGNRDFVTCSTCSELHCFNGNSDGFTCPSDGIYHKLSGGYISSLKGVRAGQ